MARYQLMIVCECEHTNHTDAATLKHPYHEYLEAAAETTIDTPYGKQHVCHDCADAWWNELMDKNLLATS